MVHLAGLVPAPTVRPARSAGRTDQPKTNLGSRVPIDQPTYPITTQNLVQHVSDQTDSGRAKPRDFNLGNVSGTVTCDFAGVVYDAVVRLTLTGNTTVNLQDVPPLGRVSIRPIQGASNFSLTIQQDASATTIRWDAGTPHVMSTASGVIDRIAGEKTATHIELGTVGKGYA